MIGRRRAISGDMARENKKNAIIITWNPDPGTLTQGGCGGADEDLLPSLQPKISIKTDRIYLIVNDRYELVSLHSLLLLQAFTAHRYVFPAVSVVVVFCVPLTRIKS